jgi:predicted membrane protein
MRNGPSDRSGDWNPRDHSRAMRSLRIWLIVLIVVGVFMAWYVRVGREWIDHVHDDICTVNKHPQGVPWYCPFVPNTDTSHRT